jgi:hypothetical protein
MATVVRPVPGRLVAEAPSHGGGQRCQDALINMAAEVFLEVLEREMDDDGSLRRTRPGPGDPCVHDGEVTMQLRGWRPSSWGGWWTGFCRTCSGQTVEVHAKDRGWRSSFT